MHISCLYLASLLIHEGLLLLLPNFLLFGMHHFCAWKKWSLNINQLSKTLLPCRACSHVILPRRSLRRPNLALLKSLVALPSLLTVLNSTVLWSLWAALFACSDLWAPGHQCLPGCFLQGDTKPLKDNNNSPALSVMRTDVPFNDQTFNGHSLFDRKYFGFGDFFKCCTSEHCKCNYFWKKAEACFSWFL